VSAPAGDEAARIAERFVNDRRIVAVVGHTSSSATLAAARLYEGHLAAVATMATSTELSDFSPWLFRVSPSDRTRGADLARFVLAQGWRRVAVLYRNGTYGRGLTSAFQEALERGGGELIAADPVLDDATDYNVFLRTYARSKPDAVLALTSPPSARTFLQQADAHRVSAHIIGGDAWPGRIADDPAANGVFILSTFFPDDTTAAATRFRTRFRARYGHDPDAPAALGYDAALAVIAALRRGGANRAGVRDALASRSGILVHGATGPISFTSGDRVEQIGGLLRVADGRLTTHLRWAKIAYDP